METAGFPPYRALYRHIDVFPYRRGGAQAQTYSYALVMNGQQLPEVKWGNSYNQLTHKYNTRQATFHSYFQGARKKTTFSFNNTDEVVAQKGDTVVFGAATYL
ncbi:hypothetical protein LN386_25495, partial [Enterobacter hormaechei subsp. steigerwaltii]|nr:hypothetical protein [Enterobacter hormaechei subsp. steigerwaltii]